MYCTKEIYNDNGEKVGDISYKRLMYTKFKKLKQLYESQCKNLTMPQKSIVIRTLSSMAYILRNEYGVIDTSITYYVRFYNRYQNPIENIVCNLDKLDVSSSFREEYEKI